MKENLPVSRAAEILMQRDNITLLCHRRPDGDTVGSAFALYYALQMLGKEVRVLCADPLPKMYQYLYPDYTPSRVLEWPVEYVVAVDVATADLLGGLEEKYGQMVDLCIDHHPSNTDYAALTCLWAGAAACAEPAAAIIKAIGLPVAGIGLIMGIDRILDMARTAVNITGDAVCTTIVAHQDGALDKSVFNKN